MILFTNGLLIKKIGQILQNLFFLSFAISLHKALNDAEFSKQINSKSLKECEIF